MDFLTALPHTLLSFIIVLSVIVFIHEFGHYLIARLCGVRIEVFSIGFGREVFGITDRTGTRWKFSWLPLGGYVKMFGDQSEASTPDSESLEKMTPEERGVSFHCKPLWQKALVVAGGPLFNFLTAITIFTYFALMNGITSTDPVIGEVMPDSAALEAGLQSGDRILQVNEEVIGNFQDISIQIMTNLGTEITLTVQRGEENFILPITPRIIMQEDALGNEVQRPLIGIRSQELSVNEVGITQALSHSVTRIYQISVMTFDVIGQLITGERSTDQLKGPIGIAEMSGQAANAGMSATLWFIAMLSVNLGLVNLLPIPLLDGGHLLYYAVEAAQGRPLAERVQQIGFRVGMVLLGTLMAFTIFNDIRQLL